jgi:hypothetical protein
MSINKRRTIQSLIRIGSSLLFLASSFVATSAPIAHARAGCPSTWGPTKLSIAMSNSQYQELFAQDFETVIKPIQSSEYSFDGITWSSYKGWGGPRNDEAFEFESTGNKLPIVNSMWSFFLSQVDDITPIRAGDLSWLQNSHVHFRRSISVEKRGCGPATTFTFEGKFPTPKITTRNFESELALTEKLFANYQDFDRAKANYAKCITKWKAMNAPATLGQRGGILEICGIANMQFGSWHVSLMPETTNCLTFVPGDRNNASAYAIKEGTACTYAVVGFDADNIPPLKNPTGFREIAAPPYDAASDSIVIFEKFVINRVLTKEPVAIPTTSTTQSTITAKAGKVSIICVKGKTTKKVVAVNPKCPAGYKKK